MRPDRLPAPELALFELSRAEGIPTHKAADRIALERIEAVATLHRMRI